MFLTKWLKGGRETKKNKKPESSTEGRTEHLYPADYFTDVRCNELKDTLSKIGAIHVVGITKLTSRGEGSKIKVEFERDGKISYAFFMVMREQGQTTYKLNVEFKTSKGTVFFRKERKPLDRLQIVYTMVAMFSQAFIEN